MNSNPFERSALTGWIFVAFLMSIPVALVLVMVNFTIGGTSPFCLPFYAGIFLVFAYFSASPIIQLMTKYNDSGIEQPSISGSKFLRWQDVKEIRDITTGAIILVGSDTKINVNLFLFRNPQSLLSAIRSQIPESAYPSEAQINREINRRKQSKAGRSAIGAFIGVVFIFAVGKNTIALFLGLLLAAFMIYELRNWLKFRSLEF